MTHPRNRAGTGDQNLQNLFFPETEGGTGSVAAVLQEPKPEPEPSLSVRDGKTHWVWGPVCLVKTLFRAYFSANFFYFPGEAETYIFLFFLLPGKQDRNTGLIQHVLTALVFWSWVLLRPQLSPSLRNLRWFSWNSCLLDSPLDICLDLLPAAPLPQVQKHKFLQHRGAHADSVKTTLKQKKKKPFQRGTVGTENRPVLPSYFV